MEYRIRSYRDDELPVSADVATKAFAGYRPASVVFTPDLVQWMATAPQVDRDMLLCAEAEGRIVGQVFAIPREVKLRGESFNVGAVTLMAVDPDFRRRGIARGLMEELATLATGKGLDGLILGVKPRQSPAYRLYEDMGFKTFYKANAPVKVLHPWALAKAMGRSYLAPLLWLKAGLKENPLPQNLVIREYDSKDRAIVLALVRQYSSSFDYVQVVSKDFWVWGHESVPPSLKHGTLVLESNGELVAIIAYLSSMVHMKTKSGETELQIAGLSSLAYRPGYEQYVLNLIGRMLNHIKQAGIPAASAGFCPNPLESEYFEGKLWSKLGFLKYKREELRLMYKPLAPKFQGLESFKTFYIQPF